MNNYHDQAEVTLRSIFRFFLALFVSLLLAGALISAGAQTADEALYRSNMLRFGAQHRVLVDSAEASYDAKLLGYYYDAGWVYSQICDITSDTVWCDFATKWARFYANQYVLPANGNIPGYWQFTTGMRKAYERSSDPALRAAIVAISQNGAYVRDSTTEDTTNVNLSREVAYGIRDLIDAAAMGAPRQYRLDKLVSDAKSHLYQWCVTPTAVPYVRPFMVALTVEALVYANRATVQEVSTCADYIWQTWRETPGAFTYTDRDVGQSGDLDPQADLNMLIYPIYGWLYRTTGELRWKERADKVLRGGVMRLSPDGFHAGGGYLFSPKQFNQNYRSAIPYVLGATLPTPTPSPTSTPQATSTPTPTAQPTPSTSPSPLPTPCPRPKTLTLKYMDCRVSRLVTINNLVE